MWTPGDSGGRETWESLNWTWLSDWITSQTFLLICSLSSCLTGVRLYLWKTFWTCSKYVKFRSEHIPLVLELEMSWHPLRAVKRKMQPAWGLFPLPFFFSVWFEGVIEECRLRHQECRRLCRTLGASWPRKSSPNCWAGWAGSLVVRKSAGLEAGLYIQNLNPYLTVTLSSLLHVFVFCCLWDEDKVHIS